jgi:hypothetical protein
MALERAVKVFGKQVVEKPFIALRLMEAHLMKSFASHLHTNQTGVDYEDSK